MKRKIKIFRGGSTDLQPLEDGVNEFLGTLAPEMIVAVSLSPNQSTTQVLVQYESAE